MYQQRPPYGYGRPGFGAAPAVNNAALLGQVLGITGFGFLITALAAYLFGGVGPMVGLIALIAGFVVLISINAVRNNVQLSLLLFYAFTFLEGIGLAPTIARYVATVGPQVVFNAAATTGLGMLAMGVVAFALSFDWRRLQGIAFGMLLGLVLVGIVSIFFRFIQPTTYAWATLAVFTLLTLVDFSRIRAGGDGLSPVQLAVSIYLDAINIFIALLQIFGGRRRD
jgi:modulator of FtsH protease